MIYAQLLALAMGISGAADTARGVKQMVVGFRLEGRVVSTVDADDLEPDEWAIVQKVGWAEPLQAGSIECNRAFVEQWSLGSVDGIYRRAR